MSEVVVVHVVAVDHLDAPQPLGVEDAFEAGHHQPHREPLLRPHRLAIHAVGDDAVFHRLGHRHARGALHFLRPFRDEPGCPAFQAALLEQRRQEHAGPFGTARHPVRLLHGRRSPRRSIARALDEMDAGDRGEPLQVLHGEGQRTVHHAVNHQAVLAGIDVRKKRSAGCPHVVERGRCDHPDRILQRGRHVKREPPGVGRWPAAVSDAYGGDVTRSVAVGNLVLALLDHRRRVVCLAAFGCLAVRGGCGSQGETTGERSAAFEEFPSSRSFRRHGSLLRR